MTRTRSHDWTPLSTPIEPCASRWRADWGQVDVLRSIDTTTRPPDRYPVDGRPGRVNGRLGWLAGRNDEEVTGRCCPCSTTGPSCGRDEAEGGG